MVHFTLWAVFALSLVLLVSLLNPNPPPVSVVIILHMMVALGYGFGLGYCVLKFLAVDWKTLDFRRQVKTVWNFVVYSLVVVLVSISLINIIMRVVPE